MEIQNETTSAISELVNLKAKIEQENSDLMEERERLKDKLRIYQEEKERARRDNSELYFKNISLKLALSSNASKVTCLAKHIEWQRSLLDDLDKQATEELGLREFEERVDNIRTSIEGAVSFYGEDSLQYELLQRTTANRDKRVELTRISGELEEKKREIEAKKKQIEEAKAAETRRLQLEEERRLKEEQERAMAEKSKQRQQFLQQRVATFQAHPVNQSLSFRPVGFNGCSPERPRQSFSSTSAMSPIGSDNENPANTPGITKPNLPSGLPSFSQLRW